MAKVLNFGVVGMGIGRHHMQGLQTTPNVRVLAACDIDEARLTEQADTFNVSHRFTDYKKLLEMEALDAVCIGTPNFLHAPMTIAALKRGLHVLCEKPMAVNARQAQRMLDAARKHRRLLMINFSYRFTEQSQALRRIVDAGEVGEIYFGRTGWLRNRGIPGMGGWFGQKEKAGGGPLIDLGVHRLDLALWLMGYPKPVSVSGAIYDKIASQIAKKQKKAFDVEDLAAGFIRFENGATLIVQASWAGNSEKREDMFTELFGAKGGVIQRNKNGTYEFEMKLFKETSGAYVETNLKISLQPTETPWQHFVRCIRTKTQPAASGEQGLVVMKILDALYRSAETGREVRIK